MFNAYGFTFAGMSSAMYGLMLYDIDNHGQQDVAFGNTAEIIETRTTGRIQPIHLGVDQHQKPLEFTLVFGSDEPLDRFDFERISYWLTGHQEYQWLTIDQPDLDHVAFRCLITKLTPISYGWLPYAFEATVTCDCPYAYGPRFEETYDVSGSLTVVFQNRSSVRDYLKPELLIQMKSGATKFELIDHSDGDRAFVLDGLPAAGLTISVDNDRRIITDSLGEYNLYRFFNLTFFRLVPGDNELEIRGDCSITISGRTLHNVAG